MSQKLSSLRLELRLMIEADHWPLWAPEVRAIRLKLTDAGDVAWLTERGWQIA
jgi:hypothetical protein